MAEEELNVVGLYDDFYRDSFGKVIFLITAVCIAIAALAGLSLYIYTSKPPPVVFPVEAEWRVQGDVAVDQPYLALPDVLQWVSDIMQKIFVLDFINYDGQLKSFKQYFTDDGWKVFQNQLNNYASYNSIQSSKLFVSSAPTGAPVLLNQGIVAGRYAWWVQIPVDINMTGGADKTISLALQILVVRVPTLNNLAGVAIDNVIVLSGEKPAETPATGNG